MGWRGRVRNRGVWIQWSAVDKHTHACRQAGVFDSLTAAAVMSHSPCARSRSPAPCAVRRPVHKLSSPGKMETSRDGEGMHDKPCSRNTLTLSPRRPPPPSPRSILFSHQPFLPLSLDSFMLGPNHLSHPLSQSSRAAPLAATPHSGENQTVCSEQLLLL